MCVSISFETVSGRGSTCEGFARCVEWAEVAENGQRDGLGAEEPAGQRPDLRGGDGLHLGGDLVHGKEAAKSTSPGAPGSTCAGRAIPGSSTDAALSCSLARLNSSSESATSFNGAARSMVEPNHFGLVRGTCRYTPLNVPVSRKGLVSEDGVSQPSFFTDILEEPRAHAAAQQRVQHIDYVARSWRIQYGAGTPRQICTCSSDFLRCSMMRASSSARLSCRPQFRDRPRVP